jgi:ABC-2 type transport system permease protein
MANKSSKIWTIIKHEYFLKVKSKAFIIGTILGPLLMLLIVAVPATVAYLSEGTTARKVAIKDDNGRFADKMIATDPEVYQKTDLSEEQLKTEVKTEKFDSYVIIPQDIMESGTVTMYSVGGGGLGFRETIESSIDRIYRSELYSDAVKEGKDTTMLKRYLYAVNVKSYDVSTSETKEDTSELVALIGYFLGLAIYAMMLMYGAQVLRGVVEEKANRIVEVIASSAKPFEIMFGKVVGIGAVGLTQVFVWGIAFIGILMAGGTILEMIMGVPETMSQSMPQGMAGGVTPEQMKVLATFESLQANLSLWHALGFLFYFLAGYFIYSSLFAAIGSAVDQEQDAQQLQGPVMIPLILPISCYLQCFTESRRNISNNTFADPIFYTDNNDR